MARSRNIKPGFFTNDALAELDSLTRLLFVGLWTIADRAGRVEDRPKRIKAEVLPYDNCDVDAMLSALEKGGFIQRYEAGGVRAIQVVNWDKHQNPHMKEAESTIPAPCLSGASTEPAPHGVLPFTERAGLIPDSLNLIPDSLHSEAKASDGDAVATKAELWKAGKSLLAEQGMPEPRCGSFVGKLVKDYGDTVVVEAVRAAVVARPADAAEYIKAVCMRSTGQRKQPESFAEQSARIARDRVSAFAPGVAVQPTIEVLHVAAIASR